MSTTLSPVTTEPPSGAADSEARRALLDHAHGRFGRLDRERIVDLVLHGQARADFTVKLAALDELALRFGAITRDALRVVSRPAGGLGDWRVRRHRGPTYRVRLTSVHPLVVSCSCPDFVRSALGICKHGLFVLTKAPKRTKPLAPQRGAVLTWDPHHPLDGRQDRLARLRIAGSSPPRGLRAGPVPATALSRPASRGELLDRLSAAITSGELDAEPAAERLVTDELRRSEAERAAVSTFPTARAALRSFGRRLYDYQREGVLRFLRSGALLLADDMGLGKTTQAIAGCHALLRARAVQRVLVVAPASLKPQWAREWRAATDEPIVVVDGTSEQRAAIYASTERAALLVGYEQLLRDIEHVRTWAPEVVVIDEAQRIKNWATKSAKTVKSLSPRYRLALTGTPLENRLDELASIVEFVQDAALEPRWRLAPLHTISDGDGGEGRAGVRDLDALRERLAPVMLRRHRSEVLSQLPARTDTRVPIELTLEQRVEHDELQQPIARLASIARTRPLRPDESMRLLRLLTQQRMIVNGLAQVRFDRDWPELSVKPATDAVLATLFAPKLGAFRSLLTELVVAQARKVVVFSQWRAMLRLAEWAVRDLLASVGKRAVFFTGAERGRERERSLVAFHDEPGTAVLFLTDAGGTGLNLQRAASACVQLELPWNPAVMEQRIARIHRLGQTQPIDVFHLVGEDCIESRIATLIGRKKGLFDALFDGTTDTVLFEQSSTFLSLLRDEADEASASPSDVEDDDELVPLTEDTPHGDIPHEDARSDDAPAPTTQLQVARRPDGGLTIDVPPAIAPMLAGVLESLAEALRRGAA